MRINTHLSVVLRGSSKVGLVRGLHLELLEERVTKTPIGVLCVRGESGVALMELTVQIGREVTELLMLH